MKEDRLLALQNTDTDDIQAFLATRESAKIPQSLQTYILQLDTVNRLLHYNRLSVRRAIDQIRKEWPTLTVAQARGIYYDAIDYFYHDDSASAAGWDRIYADQLDDLKLLCIQAGKYNTALQCALKAHELRTTVREAQDFKWQARIVSTVRCTRCGKIADFHTERLSNLGHTSANITHTDDSYCLAGKLPPIYAYISKHT